MEENNVNKVNNLYHEMKRLRYYTIMLYSMTEGPDKTFEEYGLIISDYFPDFGSFANHVNRLDYDDAIEFKQQITDIQADIKDSLM